MLPMRRSWKQGNKPYRCDVDRCGKTFFHYPSLFRHRKDKHRLIGSQLPVEARVIKPLLAPGGGGDDTDSLPNLGQLEDIEELAAVAAHNAQMEQEEEQEEENEDENDGSEPERGH